MKQIFQKLNTGEILHMDLPVPSVGAGDVLIQSTCSLISLGTERMLVEFAQANLIQKALQQPQRVKQVLAKAKNDGVLATFKTVSSQLEQNCPMGYSNVGVVIEVGREVKGLALGDRVISNGPHAEVVCVPQNLVCKVPDNVRDEVAAFTVLSAISLQGVRLIEPTLGESVAVIGLGLVGLLTCQILRAHGCRVIGFDLDSQKVELAKKYGVEAFCLREEVDPVVAAIDFSEGEGVDAVVITASTKSNAPIEQAPAMCRKRGRVVLVGVTGLTLDRSLFYEKEISFQVSCSYGPGRYEQNYEQRGMDYPIGFVRWTEQRNFQAVLQLMSEGKLLVDDLITKIVPSEDIEEVYRNEVTAAGNLGFVIKYPTSVSLSRTVKKDFRDTGAKDQRSASAARVGFVGAGAFAGAVLIPAFQKSDARCVGISSKSGGKSGQIAEKFKIPFHTTDFKELLSNDEINTIVIATRHDLHASMTVAALEAGKNVFVEKPLALTETELLEVKAAAANTNCHLMVGFNRRFSPLTVKASELLSSRSGGLSMSMTVNAGGIPASHWVHDPVAGGGRIIGEGCHFIDLMAFIAAAPVTSVFASQVQTGSAKELEDQMSVQLSFADGSIGTLHYFANGSKDFPKERLEVFSDGRVLQLNNFRTLEGFGFSRFKSTKLNTQDKGHTRGVASFVNAINQGRPAVIPFAELENSTRATFAAIESARSGAVVDVSLE